MDTSLSDIIEVRRTTTALWCGMSYNIVHEFISQEINLQKKLTNSY